LGLVNDSNWKNSTKETKFFGDIPTSQKEDKKVDFEVEGGIRGLSYLITGFLHIYDHQEQRTKIVQSFDETDTTSDYHADLYTTLFSDYFGMLNYAARGQYSCFQNNGNDYTLYEFPKHLHQMTVELHKLKGLKKAELKSLEDGGEELIKAEKAVEQAKQAVKDKETEIETKIQARIDEIRNDLKTKHPKNGLGVGETYKGFKKVPNGEDNRISLSEVGLIPYSLKNIRYLESGDEGKDSTNPNENSALTELKELWDKVHPDSGTSGTDEEKKIHHAQFFIKMGSTDKERFEKTKEMVEKPWQAFTWKDVKEGFDELEKLVILPKWYEDARTYITEYMNKPDEPQEKLSEWQSKIKTLDPLITETVFTEEKMKDFQKHNNFKKVDGILSLLKKVMDKEGDGDSVTYKVKSDFLTALKTEDGEVKGLADMITKFDAEKIIKLISKFDYEKNEKDEQKKKIRRAYSWSEGLKVNDKYVEEDGDYAETNISDADKEPDGKFTKFLFELATSVKSLSSISKPTERNEDNQKTSEKGHFEKYWGWYAGIGGLLAAGIGLIIYFWDQIKNLGEPKEEEDNE